jgi:putative two-component system response regulator
VRSPSKTDKADTTPGPDHKNCVRTRPDRLNSPLIEAESSPMTLSTADAPGEAANVSGARLIIVDDEEPIRRMLARILERSGYSCDIAADADEAQQALAGREYDLLLTDMDMPGASGLDLIMQVGRDHPDTATMMVTGMDDTTLAHSALEMGAYGYIIKPFEPNEVIINVANALRRRNLEIENRNHRMRLEQMIRDRTSELWNAIAKLERAERELRLSQEETIQRLSIAAEFRDNETAKHIQRMSEYCALLARLAGEDAETYELIRVASQMHDVGKIGIPDHILMKPAALTPEERKIMEQHAEIGYKILGGSKSELLMTAASIAYTHHERVDGTGYPRGLTEDQIPLEGRIGAIADVFDALTSNKVYKRAFAFGKAVETMRQGRGTQFDADLLDLLLGSLDTVLEIKSRYEE